MKRKTEQDHVVISLSSCFLRVACLILRVALAAVSEGREGVGAGHAKNTCHDHMVIRKASCISMKSAR